MPALLLYLLKANGALLLFAGLYYVGLRRLTFYTLNRAYLLFALLFSALYPAIDAAALFAPHERLSESLLTILPAWPSALAQPAAPLLSWFEALIALYWTGVALMSLRLLGRLFSLYRLHRTAVPQMVDGVPVQCLPGAGSPFSFGSAIYLNPTQYPASELPAILHHEQVHVRQWHTLDVLLAQVGQVLGWFNPAAWWLGRAVQENLEFLTDDAVLRAGVVAPKEYQYSLLRLSGLASGVALANHFTLLTLKTRITMMNKPSSTRAQLAQYALVLPLAAGLLFGFTSSQAGQPTALVRQSVGLPDGILYYLNGQKVSKVVIEDIPSDDIASMNVLKGATVQQILGSVSENQAILVTTKGNENAAAVVELNKKLNRSVDLSGKLLLINGKEVTRAEFERLLPSQIQQITVLDPKKAVETYGEKGRNGSAVITTK